MSVNDGSSDNNFDNLADQTVTATTTDNDVAAFTVAQTGGSTSVAETGTTDTFTVVLNAQPASDVVLSISSSDTGEATVTSSLDLHERQLEHGTNRDRDRCRRRHHRRNINSTLTVAIVDESSNDSFDAVANQTVTATTTDNDVAGFTITQTGVHKRR